MNGIPTLFGGTGAPGSQKRALFEVLAEPCHKQTLLAWARKNDVDREDLEGWLAVWLEKEQVAEVDSKLGGSRYVQADKAPVRADDDEADAAEPRQKKAKPAKKPAPDAPMPDEPPAPPVASSPALPPPVAAPRPGPALTTPPPDPDAGSAYARVLANGGVVELFGTPVEVVAMLRMMGYAGAGR